jgi:hypothetical protein
MEIPREIHDQIYHGLWIITPNLHCRFHGLNLHLFYETERYSRYEHVEVYQNEIANPAWLLTTKSMIHGALEQFGTKAEWLIPGYGANNIGQ